MKRELDHRLYEKNKQELLELLLKKYPFDAPPKLVQSRIEENKSQSTDSKAPPPDKALAEKKIKFELLFSHMIKLYKIKPDPKEVEKLITFAAMSTKNPQAFIKDATNNPQWRNYFFNLSCEKALIDHIFKYTKTKEVQIMSKDLIDYGTK